MKFRDIKAYSSNEKDLLDSLRELSSGLNRLTFLDNFSSFRTTVTDLAAGDEIRIGNKIRENGKLIVPTDHFISRRNEGAETIVDGDTAWTSENVYLKNTGASSATFTVIFFRQNLS